MRDPAIIVAEYRQLLHAISEAARRAAEADTAEDRIRLAKAMKALWAKHDDLFLEIERQRK